MGKNYRANVVKRMYTVEMQFSCGEDETVCREATLRVFAENPESALRTALHSISEDMRSAASFTGTCRKAPAFRHGDIRHNAFRKILQ